MVQRSRMMARSALVGAAVLALAACGSVGNSSSSVSAASSGGGAKPAGGKFKIVTVSKLEGIPWFERMRVGVDDFGKANASTVEARQTGPSKGDSALQIQVVQDLLAQNVDALVVVPNDPQAMAPVLKQARDKGVVVVTHEAPALAGTDSVNYDVEAFDNAKFGQAMFEQLAAGMGGKGEYAVMVAGLTNETHMAWYKAGVDYLKSKYPDMKAVTDKPYEDNNDDATARAKALEILAAHPNLKGFAGMSVSAGSNFAAVVKEKNLKGITVSTLSLPSIAGSYLKDGWMYNAQAWDPAAAATAANALALQLLEKKTPATGVNLGGGGFESVTINGKLVTGNGILKIAADDFSSGKYKY
ncbi:MAG TPA: substrate-binding domain-containing protein [Kineosporiaceae bacterium]|nr:substrate-binding domain-containing protein [Kineosporiaceae bacterium]